MRRFGRGRRTFRRRFKNPFLRTIRARMFFSATTLTTAATISHPLLTADADNNTELESNGTNTAECENFSFIKRIRLTVTIINAALIAQTPGSLFHCMLVKNPDGDLTANANTEFMNSDENSNSREIRKNCVWKYAPFVPSNGSGSANMVQFSVKPSRKAIKRLGRFQAGDVLQLWVFQGSGADGTISIVGNVDWVHS